MSQNTNFSTSGPQNLARFLPSFRLNYPLSTAKSTFFNVEILLEKKNQQPPVMYCFAFGYRGKEGGSGPRKLEKRQEKKFSLWRNPCYATASAFIVHFSNRMHKKLETKVLMDTY